MSEPVRRRRRMDRYLAEEPEEMLYAAPLTDTGPQEPAAVAEEHLAEQSAEAAPPVYESEPVEPPVYHLQADQAPVIRREAPPHETEPAEEELPQDYIPQPRDVLATNTGVRLACTMAAMMGLFALFLCWAEQESRVIRRFSVQSVLLTALHAGLGLGALLISAVLGGIPYLGLMVTLICLLAYIAGLILLVIARVKLMHHAWQGVRFVLPTALEQIVRRYY